MFTTFDWSPDDPKGKDPEPGVTGHFDNHEWLAAFCRNAFNELKTSHEEIRRLRLRIERLEKR